MTQGLRELQSYDMAAELEKAIAPLLADQLRSREAGHCMRVSDLDTDLMIRLCGRLRSDVPEANVVVLGSGSGSEAAPELTVTSTKLVELRNPKPDGTQRPPLLVFVPNEIRAAAEDSFGVATFEELNLGQVLSSVREQLIRDVPSAFRGALVEGLNRLRKGDRPWPFIDEAAVCRFLLAGKLNGADPEAYGGALYEIGLIPDFELLAEPTKTPMRMARNRDSVDTLTWSSKSERGRVLDLGLKNRAFRNQLGSYFAEAGLEDPRKWTRSIVLDRNLWPLAFNRWEFEDGGEEPDSICIHKVVTDLPTLEEDKADERTEQLIGQQVLPLGANGIKKFSTTFQVDPHPSRVQGLDKFVCQVVSRDGGPVGLVRGKKAWKSSSQQTTIAFTKLGSIEWEEGWHFVRVLPQTEDGDLIPIVDEDGNTLPWAADEESAHRRANESDLFYVLPSDDIEVEPPQRAIPNDQSLAHAILRLQFAALADGRDPSVISPASVLWAERRQRGRAVGTDQIEARFPREGAIHVPISRQLKLIEQKILGDAAGPLCWRLPISLGVPGSSTGDAASWPNSAAASEFIAARQEYFAAVRQGDKELVTQGVALRVLKPLVIHYAERYVKLIRELTHRAEASDAMDAQKALGDLRKVLALDSIFIIVSDDREQWREATLVAPTHPLRALWLATWAELGDHWVAKAKDGPKEFLTATRDALLKHLAPVAFPPVLPTDAGHVLTAVDNLNPFWTLYAPTFEPDPRGLLGDVCSAFGLPEPAIGGTVINGEYLASRLKRYLIQHPYVRTLTVNAFNAGRAAVLADMLLALQKMPEFQNICYDVRVFVHDPEAPGVAEGLATLLSPMGNITAKEADAFAIPSSDHLYPKLRLAVRPSSSFRASPEAHTAHISLMFDVFPAEDIGVARATPKEAAAPVHGLIQDFHVHYQEDEAIVAWNRQPRHGQATPLEGADQLTDLLASMSTVLSAAVGTVATGQTGLDLRPVISLALSNEDRALLHQIHEVSDWVMTLDRNMGIEFFDHGGRANRPEYLIDHSPEGLGLSGHRLVITSRSVAELEAIVRPVLQSYNLDAQGRHAVAILDQLRSLSGRLALKLISSTSQRAEALGLALSRMYLEHQGVFEDQVVVPLDAHLELYRALRLHAEDTGEEVSFKRTDLALFDLNASSRLITCRLVEVKCYNRVGDVGAYNQLKSTVAEQIQQSEEVIAYHFDPHRLPTDRPDRLIKTRELVTLLEFYLDRSERYGVISPQSADEVRFFLRTMEDGYRLNFTRSALIFDFEKPGTEHPEVENGIEYHRIGVNLIRQLIEAAAPDSDTDTGLEEPPPPTDGGPPVPQGVTRIRRRRDRAPSVPSLDSAAFLCETRERSVSWEELHSQRTLGAYEPAVIPPHDEATAEQERETEVSERKAVTHASSGPGDNARAEEHAGTPRKAGSDDDDKQLDQKRGDASGPTYDVLLGAVGSSPQYGIIGELGGRKIALDLNQTHTLSLFGVQGGGKSYTLGTIAEMASLRIPNVCLLPRPLATVIFHYSPTMDYRPEFTSMVDANTDEKQLALLRATYGADPQGLSDVVLLVPVDKLKARREEYPGIEIHPIKFAASELQTSHWRFLMGAVGNQATYIRQLNRVMKKLRNGLTLGGLRDGIDSASLPDHLKDLARMRLDLAAEYIDDNVRLSELIHPGRLIIVDLRDEFIEKDEALGLFVVLLQLFADAKHNGQGFNKLVVFDEAHKYIESPDLVAGLVEVVREMRHKGTSIMVASQDPPSVPVSLIELSSQVILHKFNSPAWLKHIQKANAALGGLTPDKMAHLKPGEAYVWSSKATDEAFTRGAIKIRVRPRVTRHGGDTRTAV